MTTIYHNPRCRKSRECHALLVDAKADIQIIDYKKTPFTETTLSDLLGLLGMKPIDLVRTNEAIWKEQFKGKPLSDKSVLNALLTYPQLIERPIVVKDGVAIVARPSEKVYAIL